MQKLEELKGMIEDEEYLFDGVELTEQEVKDQEYRKKIYKLAMEQVRNVDEILDDRYKMPDSYDEGGKQGADKRFEALTARYRDTQDADDTNPFKEQEEWESHQITMSKAQFGALDKKSAGPQYDYVFEDQIGFIKDEVMGGIGDVSSGSSDDETDDEDGNRVKKAKQRQKSARELAEVRPRIRSRLYRSRRFSRRFPSGAFSGGASPYRNRRFPSFATQYSNHAPSSMCSCIPRALQLHP